MACAKERGAVKNAKQEARKDKKKYLLFLLPVLSVVEFTRIDVNVGMTTQQCQKSQKTQCSLPGVEPEQQCLCSTNEPMLLGASVLLAL